MTLTPLDVAAYAGKLAGSFCQALLEMVGGDEPAAPVVDDFDEAAAEKRLSEGGGSYRLSGSPCSSAVGGEALPASASPADDPAVAAFPSPSGGAAGYPVIDPGNLLDAASVVLRHAETASLTPRAEQETRALARRLAEYARALTAFDNSN